MGKIFCIRIHENKEIYYKKNLPNRQYLGIDVPIEQK